MVENGSKYIVVAFRALNPEVFLDNAETKHMENDSVLRIGKRKYKTAGSFPPSSSDRYARLVFPGTCSPVTVTHFRPVCAGRRQPLPAGRVCR